MSQMIEETWWRNLPIDEVPRRLSHASVRAWKRYRMDYKREELDCIAEQIYAGLAGWAEIPK